MRTGFRYRCPCGQKIHGQFGLTDAETLDDLVRRVRKHRRAHAWEVRNLLRLPVGYVPLWRRWQR